MTDFDKTGDVRYVGDYLITYRGREGVRNRTREPFSDGSGSDRLHIFHPLLSHSYRLCEEGSASLDVHTMGSMMHTAESAVQILNDDAQSLSAVAHATATAIAFGPSLD